ncbi:hypothetical protein N7495_007203 [Penicillium taxi]|uniref:uncharacterized protein n=1 Tax=Penicillium taxi TaxID=168475 RepID=UPI0025458B03|nr:uncharacterized protein N7495_007203 [Penicillium taxi]KAJ5895512.1 hypothetical protein N7495_007203 [Penicillium taxi]
MSKSVPLIINNQHVQTEELFPLKSPKNGELLWLASSARLSDVEAAAVAAETAFPAWEALAYTTRRDLLLNAAQIIKDSREEIIATSREETAAGESWASWDIDGSVATIKDAASHVSSSKGEIPSTNDSNDTALIYKVPYGVILAIVPWNAPGVLLMSAIAYALAAGNTVIIKSSELSPRTHFLLADAFRQAGFPPGVVNLLTHAPDKGPQVIPSLIQNPAIRKITFTGSSATGRIIARLAGEALKPVVLELGGKAPAIVLEDAILRDAAHGILNGAFGHGGQVCMATERVIVLRSIETPFVEALKEAYTEQCHGETYSQPLITQSAVKRVNALVDGAIREGAAIVSGPAGYADEERRVFGPTILRSVNSTSELYHAESFGPVISLFVVDTIDEAVHLANDTEYGLAASVWSADIGNALRVAKRIRFGTIQINDSTAHGEPTLPHGGFGASGFGRLTGPSALAEFQSAKYIRFSLK